MTCCDRMPIPECVAAVAATWGATYDVIVGDDYRARASLPRHAAMFLLRELSLTRKEAARACGRSDDQTVVHAEKKIAGLLANPGNVDLHAGIAAVRALVAERGGICRCGLPEATNPRRRARKGYKPRTDNVVEPQLSAAEVDRILTEGEAREIAMPWERGRR